MDILRISFEDSNNVNVLMSLNKEYFNSIVLPYEFICKYTISNVTIAMKCKCGKGGIDVEGHQESELLTTKIKFPSFRFIANIDDGNFKMRNISSSKEVYKWLNERNEKRSNAEELWYVAMHSALVLTHLKQILIQRETSEGTEYRFPNNFRSLARNYFTQTMKEEINAKKLEGYDVVNLTFKQYCKMLDIINANGITRDINYFALPRFAVSLYADDGFQYYLYEAKGRDIHCGYSNELSKDVFWFDATFKSEDKETDTIDVVLHDTEKIHEWFLKKDEESDGAKNWEWCTNLFLLVNAFMLHYGDVAVEVEEKQAKAPTESRSHKKHDRNSVRIFKSYHLIKNWDTKARKKANYTCPCWGVRGHFRHLRNGKTIFVEAYVKGKEKDKYKGKEYNLLPYKEA